MQFSRVDTQTGEMHLETTGQGIFIPHGYWAVFESALRSRDQAVQKQSFIDYLEASVEGVASIEGYLNYRADLWNKKHSDAPLVDSIEHKVSLETKIDEWIPKMSNLQKSG